MTCSENDPIIRELKAMKRRMDILYDQSLSEEMSFQEPPSQEDRKWESPMDVWETEEMWVLSADLPGVREEQFIVQMSNGLLSISGNRSLPDHPAHATVHASERACGRFQRSFALPRDAQQDAVEAELKDGVLTVKVKRTSGESGTARKIPIQSE